ncbi:carboxymuconolactone decarboxylase family protein [Sphingomonas limnosediminicola]|jgi:4-carboxymuconolactone decarboxylase|uniref:Carboxymuconolactone decarboxylase family protein n=1 Tax=Sphingomonas limnosediminicola TaxID=940133 RepID=A0ABP7LK81_9SPHN
MSDRYRRGIDIAEQLATDKIAHFVKSGVAEVAPDFARMVIEFAFGDIYSRDGIDLRTRELIAIAALAASGRAGPQLRVHVESAAMSGISKQEVVEVLMQIALYAGFPAALNALSDCHDLLTDDNCLTAACG